MSLCNDNSTAYRKIYIYSVTEKYFMEGKLEKNKSYYLHLYILTTKFHWLGSAFEPPTTLAIFSLWPLQLQMVKKVIIIVPNILFLLYVTSKQVKRVYFLKSQKNKYWYNWGILSCSNWPNWAWKQSNWFLNPTIVFDDVTIDSWIWWMATCQTPWAQSYQRTSVIVVITYQWSTRISLKFWLDYNIWKQFKIVLTAQASFPGSPAQICFSFIL